MTSLSASLTAVAPFPTSSSRARCIGPGMDGLTDRDGLAGIALLPEAIERCALLVADASGLAGAFDGRAVHLHLLDLGVPARRLHARHRAVCDLVHRALDGPEREEHDADRDATRDVAVLLEVLL